MSAGYRVTITLGDWSATVETGADVVDVDALAVDQLSASWSSKADAFPSQPEPTTCSYSLYVPDLVAGPTIYQGQPTELQIVGLDADPAMPPFFEFYGRVSDVDAAPLNDGMRFDLVAVDYTAELAEERIGDRPWPLEWWNTRWPTVAAASRFNIDPDFDPVGASTLPLGPWYDALIAARDVDSQPTLDVIEQLNHDAGLWAGLESREVNAYWPTRFKRGPLQRWARPILCQDVAPDGTVTYRLGYVTQGDDSPGALPYRLTITAAGAQLTLKAAAPAADGVCVVPASAVERQVAWRQDKARNINRVRLTGDILTYDPAVGDEHLADTVREHASAVAARGPVELTAATTVASEPYAYSVAAVYLGDLVDTAPRWTFDQVTILPELLPGDAAWPRLFNPRAAQFAPALGRFFLLTGIPAKWNLHRRPDFPGRLIGAELTMRAGVVRLVAKILPRVPHPNGPGNAGGIRLADLPTDLTPADLGDLTALDLRLTDRPT